jgi:hypothetical protein
MVRSTVELLLDLIEGVTDRSIRLEIDSERVVRGSTRAVADNVVSTPACTVNRALEKRCHDRF